MCEHAHLQKILKLIDKPPLNSQLKEETQSVLVSLLVASCCSRFQDPRSCRSASTVREAGFLEE